MDELFASGGFALLIVSLLLAGFGIVIGFHYGNEYGSSIETKRAFWKANLYCYLGIVIATALFIALGLVTLIFLCVGFLGGFIAGIRMGYGESVGPWKAHDRFYKPHKKKGARKEKQSAKSVRHQRKSDKNRELISVVDDTKKEDM